ncbi:antibiotic biosynthesis monooxygenase [Rhodocytophaga rosea]|uniref:Antibiotic biosynthesis monooxygenase n=1 Tax=Rhodocytophaga rosea TaxID=2704465 RepID=A0A6C0GCF2_9BACT|nr:antibiotic biosynthesis monooxygenase family protein [Rhodocytophaga rosea]QHT65558.1 antibiotic biosynthesis monooxygenase [Rhodocytophaga rosea]
MTTIDDSNHYCTLINVFTVTPDKHQELFEVLKEATEKVMCHLPGYISANLHSSGDKKTVTNYAQWATLEDFLNMLRNEEAQKHMKQAASIATEFRPVIYNSIWTHTNPD